MQKEAREKYKLNKVLNNQNYLFLALQETLWSLL